MKGEILPDHIPLNKYTLQVIGLIAITATEISGIEDEIESVELPDRTVATSGWRKATEFTVMVPLHHTGEQAALEFWYAECQGVVSPVYKKPAVLTHESLSGATARAFTLAGVWPKKRKLPDLERAAEGDLAGVEWTFSADDIIPI
jgi:hypothetical protein